MWSFLSYSPETVWLRAGMAFLVSLVLSLACGGSLINYIKKISKTGQPIRKDGPQSHIKEKKGTPTMGGILILGSSIISMLLFANVKFHFVWISMLVLVVYGLAGFADDYVKVKKQTPNAMTAKVKLFIQFMAAVLAVNVIGAATPNSIESTLFIPYLKFSLELSWLYVPFALVVIAGASNAVNLSDGLDGLAGGMLAIVFSVFMVVAFATGYPLFNESSIPYIPKSYEMSVVCASLVGGCIGFLWFNIKKARIFMGDTGSLALGAVLGVVSVILKHEILLAVVGIVFVVETLSVIIQVVYFKKTGKRFFRMAPIHHHFEQLGWSENKVVYSFWGVTLLASVIGLLSLI
ncbi:MAG: phospho-N-acetylmuramoyl-pentapeptide-transferase [Alphaproteobacteria bacterium]|nr:phospho-N-acetylmuramoyl-pentapeptide-transferase [Alphaproteobacteria bacterium]